VLGARQPERLETDERDGLGLDFTQAPRCRLRIAQAGLCLDGVAEHDVRECLVLISFSD
jgi:hypothetical protein